MHKVMVSFLVSLTMVVLCGLKPAENTEKLRWMSLEEAQAAMKVEKKPILVDLYTNWCYWCKVMDKRTYSNKQVVSYLEEKFYPVKLDAETRETVSWAGKTFHFNPAYKTNDIALFFSPAQLAFPTTVIIPPDGSGPQAIPGYLTPRDIEIILKYFGEGVYAKMPFDRYQKEFRAAW